MKLLLLAAAVLLVCAQLGAGAPSTKKSVLSKKALASLKTELHSVRTSRKKGRGGNKGSSSAESAESSERSGAHSDDSEMLAYMWAVNELRTCLLVTHQEDLTQDIGLTSEGLLDWLMQDNFQQYLGECKALQAEQEVEAFTGMPHELFVEIVAHGVAQCIHAFRQGTDQEGTLLTANEIVNMLELKEDNEFLKRCGAHHKALEGSSGSGSGDSSGIPSGSGDLSGMPSGSGDLSGMPSGSGGPSGMPSGSGSAFGSGDASGMPSGGAPSGMGPSAKRTLTEKKKVLLQKLLDLLHE